MYYRLFFVLTETECLRPYFERPVLSENKLEILIIITYAGCHSFGVQVERIVKEVVEKEQSWY